VQKVSDLCGSLCPGAGFCFCQPNNCSFRPRRTRTLVGGHGGSPKSKDTPAKLASRMKRRFRIVLMRKTGQVLGTVEAADPQAAEKVAAIQFELDEFQRRRLLVRGLAR
jgi:hypothetical protein